MQHLPVGAWLMTAIHSPLRALMLLIAMIGEMLTGKVLVLPVGMASPASRLVITLFPTATAVVYAGRSTSPRGSDHQVW